MSSGDLFGMELEWEEEKEEIEIDTSFFFFKKWKKNLRSSY